MSKKIFCFDIDNTICKTIKNYYRKSKPYKNKIRVINNLYKKGHTILFFTSRGMSKYKGNLKKIHKIHYNFTCRQLKLWGVKYHKLIMGKPTFDFIIDDKSIFFRKNWEKYLK